MDGERGVLNEGRIEVSMSKNMMKRQKKIEMYKAAKLDRRKAEKIKGKERKKRLKEAGVEVKKRPKKKSQKIPIMSGQLWLTFRSLL